MKQTLVLLALVVLLGLGAVAPALAGEIGFASGQSCTVAADVPTCTPTAGRGSLVIEASVTAFVKLRDALTPGWTGTGTFTCSACQVNSGYSVCVTVGVGNEADEADTTRKELALSRLSCILRSHIVQTDKQQALDAASWDENPDVGGGDPG